MKKQTQRAKKKKSSRKRETPAKKTQAAGNKAKNSSKKAVSDKPVKTVAKKSSEKKDSGDGSFLKVFGKGRQFLKESRMELKKVKWPTRKELLASTAVVIVLTLIISLFLGLVDIGLIKIIKTIVR